MTDPTDPHSTPGKGRLYLNAALLILNIIITVYFMQNGSPLFALLFVALAIRNVVIVYKEWRTING